MGLLSLLAFEAMVRLCVAQEWLPHQSYPVSSRPRFWASIDPAFGIWRHPDTRFRHREKCIDQIYTSNSVGARDRERALDSPAERRVVVLGDSYVEGLGVADGERLTDRLESSTGIEHLNFGSAGYFGTVQQWLVYDTLASRYEHSDVFVFLYPENDFDDNDPASFSPREYRPFLRRNGDGLELYYTVEFDERDLSERSRTTALSNQISNRLYSVNILRTAIRTLKEKNPGGSPTELSSRYDHYTQEDRDRMFYALDRIVATAGPRRVHLFTIPSLVDYAAATRGTLERRLPGELQRFAAEHGNVEYLDLLPAFEEAAGRSGGQYRDFTLGCDGHWSPAGHAVAAEAVRAAALR